MTNYYLSHPEVLIDAAVEVPRWPLSEAGRARAARAALLPWMAEVRRIVSSDEQKAVDTAEIIAAALGLEHTLAQDARLGELDRSATGFLPPEEFERVVDEFFAEPERSIRGWETARHAQERIVDAVRSLSGDGSVPTLFVAHGGVGALLACDLIGAPIDRSHDQLGMGSWYSFDVPTWSALNAWQRVE